MSRRLCRCCIVASASGMQQNVLGLHDGYVSAFDWYFRSSHKPRVAAMPSSGPECTSAGSCDSPAVTITDLFLVSTITSSCDLLSPVQWKNDETTDIRIFICQNIFFVMLLFLLWMSFLKYWTVLFYILNLDSVSFQTGTWIFFLFVAQKEKFCRMS